MSQTGGGHRASALALQAGFDLYFPGRFEVSVIDLLADYTFWPLDQSPQIYASIATHAPWLWGAAFATERSPALAHGLMRAASLVARDRIQSALEAFRPDFVISVHPLAQELTLGALRARTESDGSARPPFFTVVTDLATVHPLWLHPEVDGCYVAASAACDAALRAGLRADQVHLLGLPVRTAFAEAYPPARELKAKLSLKPELPLALLMGGGDGIGPVEEIAAAVAAQLAGERPRGDEPRGDEPRGDEPRGQLAVVCGRNEVLRARLAGRSWPIPTRILGFVEAMPEWMYAASCLITKAGPGSIAEATICGLPMILSGFIPGQEAGNIPWVVDQGAGIHAREPERIGRIVAEWFGPRADARAQMAARAKSLGRPYATRDIVHSIVAQVDRAASQRT